jgi:hypothetical protein
VCTSILVFLVLIVAVVLGVHSKRLQGNIAAIGPLVGLLGIAAVAFLNAYLARRRDDALRRIDAAALAAGLIGEIEVFVQSMGITLAVLPAETPKESSVIVTLIRNTQQDLRSEIHERIYGANIKQLGLLPLPLVRDVVDFYCTRHMLGYEEETLLGVAFTAEHFRTFRSFVENCVNQGRRLVPKLQSISEGSTAAR